MKTGVIENRIRHVLKLPEDAAEEWKPATILR